MAGLVRTKAEADQVEAVLGRLVQLDRDLMSICCADSNPLTLKSVDELARLHRKLRRLRHLIEIEAGKC